MIEVVPKSQILKMGIYYNDKEKTMSQIKKELGCDKIMNAGLYDLDTREPEGLLVVDGKTLHNTNGVFGYAINGSTMEFSYSNLVKYPTFISAYPVLVRYGKPTGDKANVAPNSYRTAIGMKANGDVVLYCNRSNVLLDTLASTMVAQGCDTAINFDGGESSSCDFGNGKTLYSSRACVTYFVMWIKKTSTTTPSQKKKVCIDPGHSAAESNGSPDGTYKEHEFALDVGKRIKAILERHGVDVVMTRMDGSAVSLAERCSICNNANCDLFVSLHTNASGSGWTSPSGWEAHIVANGGKAEKLAKAIEAETVSLVGCTSRGVKLYPGLKVVRDTDCPAVLVEHGFHTNKQDVEKLKSDAWRQKYAEADAKGVLETLGVAWKPETTVPVNPPAQTKTEAEKAREWAKAQGISDGTYPDRAATRQEVWTMLYRMQK